MVQWVLNGCLVTLAALLVLGGQLGDLLGRRRIFTIGTLVFAAASACTYVAKLHSIINRGPLADLDVAEYERFAPTSSPPRAPD
jgi:MFS family permease